MNGKVMDMSYEKLEEVYNNIVNTGNLYYFETPDNSNIINEITIQYLGTPKYSKEPGGTYRWGNKTVKNAFSYPYGTEEANYYER